MNEGGPPRSAPAVRAEYADAEAAALYDLQYDGYDEDLSLYEQSARRGELPSLELCVGSGRVALHLARSALHVVGIDSSRAMLARCEAKLDRQTARYVRLVEGDIRGFDLQGEKFDLIYCALNSFELLPATRDQLAALGRVSMHLAPGGVFVAQLRSPVHADWSGDPSPLAYEWSRVDPESGETVHKMSSRRASRAEQTEHHTMMFDRVGSDGVVRRRTLAVTLRMTALPEMAVLLERSGLRLAQVYGGADLSPYDDESDSMVIVAEHA